MRWYGLGFRATALQPPAPPGWSRLFLTRSGACLTRAPGLLATIAAHHGLLVGERTEVALHAAEYADLRILYVTAHDAVRTRPVVVTPLLRALVDRVVDRGALDAHDSRDRRVIEVIGDEIKSLVDAPFGLALPHDPRARRVAEHCLMHTNPDVPPLSAAHLAALAKTSPRTLERLFLAQTGCSVGRWQRQMLLLLAQRALVAGSTVTDAAYEAGYASPSAFIAAFRVAFGVTPGRGRH